jgi:hypothetical protein
MGWLRPPAAPERVWGGKHVRAADADGVNGVERCEERGEGAQGRRAVEVHGVCTADGEV